MAMTRNEAGFGLIEVIVAIVILSVGILALSRTGSQSISTQTKAATHTVALAIARKHMEQLKSQPAATVQSESPVTVNTEGEPDAGGTFTRTVTVDLVDPTLQQVKVTVLGPTSTKPVELVTLMYLPPK
jgi:type IV pilus modification protein PilV